MVEKRTVLESQIPDALNVDGQLQTQMRYRGIYGTPIYRSLLHLEAVFPANWQQVKQPEQVLASRPSLLVLQISDLRGLVERPQILVNDVPLALVETEQLPSGLGANAVECNCRITCPVPSLSRWVKPNDRIPGNTAAGQGNPQWSACGLAAPEF